MKMKNNFLEVVKTDTARDALAKLGAQSGEEGDKKGEESTSTAISSFVTSQIAEFQIVDFQNVEFCLADF
jgi:hypothetical protein